MGTRLPYMIKWNRVSSVISWRQNNYRTDGPGRISMSHLGTTVELGATSCQAQRHFLECFTILEPSDPHLMIVTYF